MNSGDSPDGRTSGRPPASRSALKTGMTEFVATKALKIFMAVPLSRESHGVTSAWTVRADAGEGDPLTCGEMSDQELRVQNDQGGARGARGGAARRERAG